MCNGLCGDSGAENEVRLRGDFEVDTSLSCSLILLV